VANPFKKIEHEGGVTEWRHPGNGLTVLTAPTPVAPVVAFGIVYRVGSRHELPGHTGATHILEHLMFKGTERFNRDNGTEAARELHRVGASFNATTWLDRTNYFEILPVDRLVLAVDIESDRMRGALVRDTDLESERTVVLNELDAGENDSFDLLMKSSFALAYLEHPYRHPTIGWRGDVESMTGGVLRGFYDTFYHPDNATVIVAGDLDPEQRGERRFELHRTGELGNIALSWHIPEGLHAKLPALSVLTQILGDGVTSRLYQRLVETSRCLGVHAYAMELHDPGLFQIFATLSPGVGHREAEDAIRAEVAELVQTPPSDDEMARALAQARTDLAFHHESPGQILGGLTEAAAMGDWRRFVRDLELVRAVTADDLQQVAETYLKDSNLTVGWFVPENGSSAATEGAP
jgi:zinc protease